jgi:hypothetical protein
MAVRPTKRKTFTDNINQEISDIQLKNEQLLSRFPALLTRVNDQLNELNSLIYRNNQTDNLYNQVLADQRWLVDNNNFLYQSGRRAPMNEQELKALTMQYAGINHTLNRLENDYNNSIPRQIETFRGYDQVTSAINEVHDRITYIDNEFDTFHTRLYNFHERMGRGNENTEINEILDEDEDNDLIDEVNDLYDVIPSDDLYHDLDDIRARGEVRWNILQRARAKFDEQIQRSESCIIS